MRSWRGWPLNRPKDYHLKRIVVNFYSILHIKEGKKNTTAAIVMFQKKKFETVALTQIVGPCETL